MNKLFSSKSVTKPWTKVRLSESAVAHAIFIFIFYFFEDGHYIQYSPVIQNHSDSIALLKTFAHGPAISCDSSFRIWEDGSFASSSLAASRVLNFASNIQR